jgi:hypothetical protein
VFLSFHKKKAGKNEAGLDGKNGSLSPFLYLLSFSLSPTLLIRHARPDPFGHGTHRQGQRDLGVPARQLGAARNGARERGRSIF